MHGQKNIEKMSYFILVCVTGRRNDPLSIQWNFTAICYCKNYMRNQKTRNLTEINNPFHPPCHETFQEKWHVLKE